MIFFDFLRILFKYIKPYKWSFLIILGCTFVEVAYESSLRYSLKFIIDEVIKNQDKAYFTTLFLLIFIGGIFYTIFSILSDYYWAKYGTMVINRLSADLFDYIQYLPMKTINKYNIGDLLSRFNVDIREVENGLIYAIPASILAFGGIFLSSLMLLELNIYLFSASVVGIIISIFSPKIIQKITVNSSYSTQTNIGSITSYLNENISFQSLIKVYTLQEYSKKLFNNKLDTFLKFATKSYFFSYLSMRLPSFSFLFSNILVLAIGVWFTLDNKMTIGSLTSYLIIFFALNTSIESTTYFIPTIVTARAALDRLLDIFNEKTDNAESKDTITLDRFQDKIVFQDVCFGYQPNKQILNSISFEIPKGKFVAFVGHNGSGKTSIINLILRIYDIDSGQIFIDDHPIQDISLYSLRKQIGFVSQNIVLFDLTIEENIKLGKLDATKEEVIESAQNADIHDFIITLPDGYQTKCGEWGSKFSGGQRQKIALARALIRKPAILILDEATSALDPVSEQSIINTLNRLKKNLTIIAITHKLNLAEESDIIYIVENGQILEKDNSVDLLKKGSKYE